MRWHLIARPGQQFFLGMLENSHERKWDGQRRWVERTTTNHQRKIESGTYNVDKIVAAVYC